MLKAVDIAPEFKKIFPTVCVTNPAVLSTLKSNGLEDFSVTVPIKTVSPETYRAPNGCSAVPRVDPGFVGTNGPYIVLVPVPKIWNVSARIRLSHPKIPPTTTRPPVTVLELVNVPVDTTLALEPKPTCVSALT